MINTEDWSLKTVKPFGDLENMHDLKVIKKDFMPLMERIVFATSSGLHTGMLSQDGTLQSESKYFENCNVTNIELIKDDHVFVTLNDEEGLSSLYTIDTATEQKELVIDQDDYNNSFDMDKVPGFDGD